MRKMSTNENVMPNLNGNATQKTQSWKKWKTSMSAFKTYFPNPDITSGCAKWLKNLIYIKKRNKHKRKSFFKGLHGKWQLAKNNIHEISCSYIWALCIFDIYSNNIHFHLYSLQLQNFTTYSQYGAWTIRPILVNPKIKPKNKYSENWWN